MYHNDVNLAIQSNILIVILSGVDTRDEAASFLLSCESAETQNARGKNEGKN